MKNTLALQPATNFLPFLILSTLLLFSQWSYASDITRIVINSDPPMQSLMNLAPNKEIIFKATAYDKSGAEVKCNFNFGLNTKLSQILKPGKVLKNRKKFAVVTTKNGGAGFVKATCPGSKVVGRKLVSVDANFPGEVAKSSTGSSLATGAGIAAGVAAVGAGIAAAGATAAGSAAAAGTGSVTGTMSSVSSVASASSSTAASASSSAGGFVQSMPPSATPNIPSMTELSGSFDGGSGSTLGDGFSAQAGEVPTPTGSQAVNTPNVNTPSVNQPNPSHNWQPPKGEVSYNKPPEQLPNQGQTPTPNQTPGTQYSDPGNVGQTGSPPSQITGGGQSIGGTGIQVGPADTPPAPTPASAATSSVASSAGASTAAAASSSGLGVGMITLGVVGGVAGIAAIAAAAAATAETCSGYGFSCGHCSIEACSDGSSSYYKTSDGHRYSCSGSNCTSAASSVLSHCGCTP